MFKSMVQTLSLIFTFELETKLIILTMKKIFYSLFSLLIFSACDQNPLLVDLSEVETEVQIKRFDHALFEQDAEKIHANLDQLASEFPVFISGDYKNEQSIQGLIEYILNPLNQKLYLQSIEVHNDFKQTSAAIKKCFNYYSYYFPKKELPVVYTYISSLNYEESITVRDSFALVGIDMFLGQNFEEYKKFKIPLFVSKRYDKKYLPSELMRNIAFFQFKETLQGETLLDYMISLGKVEYFVKAMAPELPDSVQFAFSPTQMKWCIEREWALWQHLTSKELLFSKDYHEFKKYIEDQPFISSLERDSPGRAGVWMGYLIVKAYMDKNPEVTLEELLTTLSTTEIFQGSKYKP